MKLDGDCNSIRESKKDDQFYLNDEILVHDWKSDKFFNDLIYRCKFKMKYSDFDDLNFLYSNTIQVSKPTGCGHTRFVFNLLNERRIEPFAKRLIWVYSKWQLDYDLLKENIIDMEFVRGFSKNLYNYFLL